MFAAIRRASSLESSFAVQNTVNINKDLYATACELEDLRSIGYIALRHIAAIRRASSLPRAAEIGVTTTPTERSTRMTSPDQICFYDEPLKKQIEGSYTYDGKAIHVCSVVFGARSAPRGGCLDHNEVDLLAQKVLSELARDAEKDTAKSHSYKKAA
jgi:hypothetical protein